MPTEAFENARLVIDRASEHIDELNGCLINSPPFSYILESNTQTGERATLTKQNKAIIGRVKTISSEIVHALRTAIDYAYWDVVSPHVVGILGKSAEHNIQFPFSSKAEYFLETAKKRNAHRVSEAFIDELQALAPYPDGGGNKLLFLIHELDRIRKHRFPTPVGDYKQITAAILRRQIPDFPAFGGTITISGCGRDIVWRTRHIPQSDLERIVPPFMCKFEKELHVPVQVIFSISEHGYFGGVVETLSNMRSLTHDVLSVMEKHL